MCIFSFVLLDFYVQLSFNKIVLTGQFGVLVRLPGLILCKNNSCISSHMDNLNLQLQLHVRISVPKCKNKLIFKLSVVLIEQFIYTRIMLT
jgi:hypothetical protein